MKIYKCNKCGKLFDHKHNYLYHISKMKIQCIQTIESPPIPDIIEEMHTISRYKIYNQNLEEPICIYCGKLFKSNSHRNRHMNQSCKTGHAYKKIISDLDVIILELKKENELLNEKYNDCSKEPIYKFGMEKFNYTDNTIIINAINNPFIQIPELIKDYHFNPLKKKYNNIKIKNPLDNYYEIYTGTNWRYESKDIVIETLIRTYKDIIDIEFNKATSKFTEETILKYREFTENIDNYIMEIYTEISITIYKKIYKLIEIMLLNEFRENK